jgi:hypothetical protein
MNIQKHYEYHSGKDGRKATATAAKNNNVTANNPDGLCYARHIYEQKNPPAKKSCTCGRVEHAYNCPAKTDKATALAIFNAEVKSRGWTSPQTQRAFSNLQAEHAALVAVAKKLIAWHEDESGNTLPSEVIRLAKAAVRRESEGGK